MIASSAPDILAKEIYLARKKGKDNEKRIEEMKRVGFTWRASEVVIQFVEKFTCSCLGDFSFLMICCS